MNSCPSGSERNRRRRPEPGRRWLIALVILLGGVSAAQAAPTTRRLAVVVGANASSTPDSPIGLKFAGTDARMNAEVLRLAGYDTAVLASDGPVSPTYLGVVEAIGKLVQRVREMPGDQVEVIFWYSGHGSEEALFLEDRPMTNTVLRTILLQPLAGRATVHLIIDACGALAFTTGWSSLPVVRVKASPGRNPTKPVSAERMAKGLNLEELPHVGVMLGTTLAGKAIEAPSFQSGLLSYQLRSAILGGADASALGPAAALRSEVRDGRVTYREAEAFIWAANADIQHTDVRMYVWARGPSDRPEAQLVNWALGSERTGPAPVTLALTGDDQAHFWVADAHAAEGTPNLFHINKGREQSATAGVTFMLPPRRQYIFTIQGQGMKYVIPPEDGRLTWAAVKQTPFFAQLKGSDPGQALQAGLFRRPYTIEVYWTYDRLKGTLGSRRNEVLLREAPPPQAVSRAGSLPYWLWGGATAVAGASWFAWRHADEVHQQWGTKQKGTAEFEEFRKRTARWDRTATAGFIAAGALAAAGGAVFVYRLRAGEEVDLSFAPVLGPGATGLRVQF